jgi:hypothetical protein
MKDFYENEGQKYSDKYEVNPVPECYHEQDCDEIDFEEVVDLLLLKEDKIESERMRFVTDSGYPYYDLSYWHIKLNGQRFRVLNSPFEQLPKRKFKQLIYSRINARKVFINNLFASISTLD